MSSNAHQSGWKAHLSTPTAFNLTPPPKAIAAYYDELEQFTKLGVTHETAVRDAFQALLKTCCKQANLTLVAGRKIPRNGRAPIFVDGAMVGADQLARGYWEAKDEHDDLAREVKKKLAVGYPTDNTIFQAPQRAILYQNGKRVLDEDITRPKVLVDTLKQLFEYRAPMIAQWEEAASKFQSRVHELAEAIFKLIERERKTNIKFIAAFADFTELCRASINPNISHKAVEEMLIQHLLTERIFRNVFKNSDFAQKNIIAAEIEKVIRALTSKSFSRTEFLKSSDYFYRSLEETAATVDDFTQKQSFLNKVYEQFFQGFSVKMADTHGIVYTPQPIVNFMVRSVEDILRNEFGSSLSSPNVHVLDPFVGTGNFIVRVMKEVKRTQLEHKFKHELHCNEVMLLPYYIASMTIEHEFYERTGNYESFKGICLVDSFELAESRQVGLFTEENLERIENQKRQRLFVIIGNPPYNAGQVNENDNNKNRKYEEIDKRVAETYVKDSKAKLRNKLSDPYVKAIRLASDRITESGEGVVAIVTNNSFLDQIAFDGMRKHLAQDFDAIYVLDLGGNVRKNPKLSGTKHNVFGIQVGVSINLFVRRRRENGGPRMAKIYYARVGEDWRKEDKYKFLDETQQRGGVEWQELHPDAKHTWLTEGMRDEFESFLPMGNRETKSSTLIKVESIFKTFSGGMKTNRDVWVNNFDRIELENNVERIVGNYNAHVYRFEGLIKKAKGIKKIDIDKFVDNDERQISWSSTLKEQLRRRNTATFDSSRVRSSLYRPYCKQHFYYDAVLNDRRGLLPTIFPTSEVEKENISICVNVTSEKPFTSLASNVFPNYVMTGGFGSVTQCFPLYIYNGNGTESRENITDWALARFRTQYSSKSITKLDIFHYVYALLHHPAYRTTYAANLKRELPRIPLVARLEDFRAFVCAGRRLAYLHVDYEAQPEYKLEQVEKEGTTLDWRVERMRLSKDKTSIVYNDFLTLTGIPPGTFEYRLGNRSALEWVIDQYQVSTDKRSGITNDPNREDDEQYIIRLIGQVITVSLETVKIVRALPELGIDLGHGT